MSKRFTRAGEFGGPAKADLTLIEAYKRLFDGHGNKQDAEMVMADLASATGYYRRPSLAEWMTRTRSPEGYELHCALCNARAEVLQHIMDKLQMDDDTLVSLEQAARLESVR